MGWVIAGICMSAFVILWFCVSHRELSAIKKNLDTINEQIMMHRRLYMQ